jgi:serine/threonine-protein kinase RsbW
VPPSEAPDEVVLTLPAAPEFVRLARLTCAGLATRIGMGYDEVEDLRIAVGEACSLLIGAGGRTGTLTLTFALVPDTVAIAIVGTFDAPRTGEVDSALSDQILDAVVDEHVVDIAGDAVTISKQHRASSEEADGIGPA